MEDVNKELTKKYKHDTILFKVFEHNGQAFGGYVRDFLANETPKDLDVKFPDEKAALEFIGDLSKLGIVTLVQRENIGLCAGSYGDYYNVRVYRVQVHYLTKACGLEEEVNVDVVVGNPWACPDLDVNLLQMDRNGITVGVAGYSFSEILEHIQAKEARVLPTCTVVRRAMVRAHIRQRGWTELVGLGSIRYHSYKAATWNNDGGRPTL